MKWVSGIICLLCVSSPIIIYAQFLDDTPGSPEETAPAPHGVEPVIPLDKEDPTYDLWKKRRDDLGEGRDPGPINIQRYPGGMTPQGIPSFFRLPIALNPDDLRAGQVEVAMIGAYIDMGFGSHGAVFGPQAFRAPPADYGTWGAFSMPHMPTLINPFEELTMVDYGDAPIDPLSTERSVHAVRELVREITEVKLKSGKHVFPLIIGGDYSLTYPNLAGITDVYGKGHVGVIHFDAHYDATQALGHLISHGGWVKRLIKEGHVPGKNYIHVALRG